MADPINICEPVAELCGLLGLEPNNVRKLTVGLKDVVAEVYLLNDNGKKHVDLVTGEPAVEERRFEVTTT